MAKEFQPGQEIQGFLIEEEIGRGGMGIVYRAVQKSLQRTVALKKIPEYLAEHPDILTRFQREALATARLNHSGIVQIYCPFPSTAGSGVMHNSWYMNLQQI